MALTTRLVPAVGRWLDFGSALHPPEWYQSVKLNGYHGVILDCMTPGVEHDYGAALEAGLAVMWFQGYWEPAWTGGESGARRRAEQAVTLLQTWRVPVGTCLWLDSEAWPSGVSATDASAWITAWATAVTAGHLSPGLYVGANQPLNGEELWALPAIHRYWRSAGDVPTPSVRGYQLVQTAVNQVFNGFSVDTDEPQRDHLGGTPWGIVADPGPAPPATGPVLVGSDPTLATAVQSLATHLQILTTTVDGSFQRLQAEVADLRRALPTRGTITLD